MIDMVKFDAVLLANIRRCMLQALFKAIASTVVGLQNERTRRALKHRSKSYSLLTISMREACTTL